MTEATPPDATSTGSTADGGEGRVASMTGVGSAVLEHELGRFEAEARSVNHRFLKVSVRTSGPLPVLEGEVEAAVKGRAARGHVSVFLRFRPAASEGPAALDEDAFAAAAARLKALASAQGLPPVTVGDILQLPGLLDERRSADPKALGEPALEAAGSALDALVAARRREGADLAAEIRRLLDQLLAHVRAVEARADEVPAAIRARLEARLRELLEEAGVEPDPQHVLREAAALADRADVREEIARLVTHVAHAREVLDAGGPIGRRLDFLVQEMHRETNTIGSKVQEAALARRVVDMKTDVERLREQVQNLE